MSLSRPSPRSRGSGGGAPPGVSPPGAVTDGAGPGATVAPFEAELQLRRQVARRAEALWRGWREDKASPERVSQALALIPELCAALEDSCSEIAEAQREIAALRESGRARGLDRYRRLLAHEIRNRVNVAELALERWKAEHGPSRDGGPDARLGAALHSAFRQLAHLADDLHALMDRRRRSGDERPRLARPIAEVLRDLLTLNGGAAERRQARLILDEPLPDGAVDGARIELVIANLLANSLKHLDPAKEDRWVRLGVDPIGEPGGWRFRVADNGVGIPESIQALVFQEELRYPSGGADGEGLGLSIARRAVEQMGGRIWLTSAVGAGTTVYFTVPDGKKLDRLL